MEVFIVFQNVHISELHKGLPLFNILSISVGYLEVHILSFLSPLINCILLSTNNSKSIILKTSSIFFVYLCLNIGNA